MDSVSIEQILRRIPELWYKYLGTFSADSVPHLPKFTFAIVNNQPSNERGEHWIMIARTVNEYFYADSLGKPQRKYPFLRKKYHRMISRELQQFKDVCGFYTIYAAYQLFKFNLRHLDNIHDVHILNFISNYM